MKYRDLLPRAKQAVRGGMARRGYMGKITPEHAYIVGFKAGLRHKAAIAKAMLYPPSSNETLRS
jgi:hypothetical protein